MGIRSDVAVFFVIVPPPPRSTLFPYTTLFRSQVGRDEEIMAPAVLVRDQPDVRRREVEIGRAHVRTPVTHGSRMPASAGERHRRARLPRRPDPPHVGHRTLLPRALHRGEQIRD